MKISIGSKFSILFISMIFVLGISIFVFLFGYAKSVIEHRITAQMESVVTLKMNQLNKYFEEEMEDLKKVILRNEFVSKLEMNTKKDEIRSYVQQELENNEDFFEIFIIDKEGKVYVSTDINQEDKIKSSENYFVYGRSDDYVQQFYYDTSLQKIAITMATPLNTGGDEYVLAGRIDIASISKIMTERSGMGDTGETYLVNKFNVMVTESRFIPGSELKQTVYTEGARNCLKKLNGNGIYDDYRGISVIGVYEWVNEHDYCIIAEIDEEEAFESIITLRNISTIYTVVLIVLMSIPILFFSKRINKRIRSLQSSANEISKGHLTKKINIKSVDEIGEFAITFDKMRIELLKAHDEINKYNKQLERKVRERTKELAEEKNKFQKTLESLADGAFVIDQDEKILFFNPAAENMTQFKKEEAIGNKYEKIIKFIKEKNGEENYAFIQQALYKNKTTSMRNHTIIVTKSGKRIPILSSAAPIHYKTGRKSKNIVVTFRDVSEERKIEKMKDDFISLASHQLRTPLSSIKWSLELLLKTDKKRFTNTQIDTLENSFKAAVRMNKIINMILNIARIESGNLIILPKKIDIDEFIQNIIIRLHPILKIRKQNITVNIAKNLTHIDSDPNLLDEVLSNLISNSAKYTKNNGKIEINVASKNKYIAFEVKDNGYGIPNNQKKKIFSKFFRADNIIRKDTDGNGLGLSITRQLVELLDGKIWFESNIKKGTSFFFTIPKKKAVMKDGEKELAKSY